MTEMNKKYFILSFHQVHVLLEEIHRFQRKRYNFQEVRKDFLDFYFFNFIDFVLLVLLNI